MRKVSYLLPDSVALHMVHLFDFHLLQLSQNNQQKQLPVSRPRCTRRDCLYRLKGEGVGRTGEVVLVGVGQLVLKQTHALAEVLVAAVE